MMPKNIDLDYCGGAVINNNVCDIVVRLSLFYGEHLFWLLKYVLVSWLQGQPLGIDKK
mgnify:CR=1 FL=1